MYRLYSNINEFNPIILSHKGLSEHMYKLGLEDLLLPDKEYPVVSYAHKINYYIIMDELLIKEGIYHIEHTCLNKGLNIANINTQYKKILSDYRKSKINTILDL